MKRKTARETDFQADLKKEIASRFPGSTVMKTDPNQIQGIPDLLVLYKDRWALLECKRNEHAVRQQNQDWYVEYYNQQSFAAVIYPENKDIVLGEMEKALKGGRQNG